MAERVESRERSRISSCPSLSLSRSQLRKSHPPLPPARREIKARIRAIGFLSELVPDKVMCRGVSLLPKCTALYSAVSALRRLRARLYSHDN